MKLKITNCASNEKQHSYLVILIFLVAGVNSLKVKNFGGGRRSSERTVYNPSVEDDLNKLKSIFNRNSMFVLNEFTHSRQSQNQLTQTLDLPYEPMNDYDEIINLEHTSKNKQNRQKRRIIQTDQYGTSTRWPNNTIPYEFDYDATELLKKRIRIAIYLWESQTCIRFEKYSPSLHPNHKSMILIKNRGHCAARVGYVIDPTVKLTVSDVFLPEHCPQGSVIHELGHVIGFRHEHTRTDRGKHIIVHYDRMQPTQRLQYEPMLNGQQDYYGVYYDLFSIMHYSTQGGLLEALDPKRSFLMGQRFMLSFSDVKMANMAYKCNDKCPIKQCMNEGFVNAKCDCQCPEYITGDLCQYLEAKNKKMQINSNPKLTCDFSADFCDWIQDVKRDTTNWIKNSQHISMKSSDNTLNSAILISPEVSVNGPSEHFCLEFDYRIHDSNGVLKIQTRDDDGRIRIWKEMKSQGNDWLHANSQLEVKGSSFLIFLEAKTYTLGSGEINLDNIKFRKGPCTHLEQMSVNHQRPVSKNQTIGVWSKWSDWSKCVCANTLSIRIRTRNCEMVSGIDMPNCPGLSIEKQLCPETNQCTHSLSKSTEWSEWSKCSVDCGTGFKTRTRKCSSSQDIFCQSKFEVITQKASCIANCSTGAWSEWSDWSRCSVSCGIGFMIRKRTCPSKTCQGKAFETKECSVENNCFKQATTQNFSVDLRPAVPKIFSAKKSQKPEHKWSAWSEWTECMSKSNCGKGVRSRKRMCQSVDSQIASSFNCSGASFAISNCQMEECANDKWSEWSSWEISRSFGYMKRNRKCLNKIGQAGGLNCHGKKYELEKCSPGKCPQVNIGPALIEEDYTWSDWSNCSLSCGNGFKTRFRKCLKGELNCHDRRNEEMTCTSYAKCSAKNYFMVCSFDKKEYCSLEAPTKDGHWTLRKEGITEPVLPKSFGNFLYIYSNSKTTSGKLSTPVISDVDKNGQCLFFNYFSRNNSKLEINRIITKTNSNTTLFTSDITKTNKWTLALVTIKSPENYYIQFNGVTSTQPDSLVALDNLVLHPIEFCRILDCSFENTNCIENLFPYQPLQDNVWKIKNHSDSSNHYLSADIGHILRGKKSFYGLPLVNPLHSKMCIRFFYRINTFAADLRLILVWKRIDLKQLWSFKAHNRQKNWQKVMIEIDEETPFQLIIDVYKKTSDELETNSNEIGIDNLEVMYGKCDQAELKELEREELAERKDYLARERYNKIENRPRRAIANLDGHLNSDLNKCGGIYELRFAKTLILNSPGYPNSYNHNQECTFLIKVPKGLKIFLKILDLDIEDNEEHIFCNDYLEIRYFNLAQPGPKFCGNLRKYNGILSFTSFQESIMLIFSSDWAVTRRGFKIQANMAL